jgi:hypothetical protein
MVDPKNDTFRGRFVHESRKFELDAPSPWTALLAGALGGALAVVFAGTAAVGLQGSIPPWGSGGIEIASLSLRVLCASTGLICGVAAIVLAAAYYKRAENLLRLRLRMIPILESEGPCRLVQEAPHRWGLELSLDPLHTAHPAHALIAETRGSRGHPWEPGPAHCRLFFRLDEAEVAALSRIFHPDEELRLRWADLPLHSGGPTLLRVQTTVRELRVGPPSAAPSPRRRTIRSKPPETDDGHRRAA